MALRNTIIQCGLLFSCSVSCKLDDKHTQGELEDKYFWSVWRSETFFHILETHFDLICHFQGAEVTDLRALRYGDSRKGFMKIKQEILA